MNIIRDCLLNAQDKGRLLEFVVEGVLKDQGFRNVKRQHSGSQFGSDLVGYKNDDCWKFECKNFNRVVGINDIAPKLIWHINSPQLQRFVIITTSSISNEVRYLLEKTSFSFPVEVWDAEYLEKLIANSDRAKTILNISETVQSFEESEPLVFPGSKIKFNVVYNSGEPFSVDYFRVNENVYKAFSHHSFKVTASLKNETKEDTFITQINVKTLKYFKVKGRVLRQYRQKGLVTPLHFSFSPANNEMGLVHLLPANKIIELKSNSTEYYDFELQKKLIPGYYEIIFEAIINVKGETRAINSSVFCLHIKEDDDVDIVQLCVSKYYDTPVSTILDLGESDWKTIKDRPRNTITYLGNTDWDVPEHKLEDKTWLIKELTTSNPKRIGNRTEADISRQKPEIVLDLKIPVEEPIMTVMDAKKELGFYGRLGKIG